MTDQQKSYIKHLVQSPEWRFIEDFAKQLTDKIKEDSTIRDSEWETIKFTLQREGKIEGIKNLLQEMFIIGTQ